MSFDILEKKINLHKCFWTNVAKKFRKLPKHDISFEEKLLLLYQIKIIKLNFGCKTRMNVLIQKLNLK